ncbi:M20/M25/M40 family metallo-hydrolase [Flavobacterium sp. W22_SRS_FP1]|uniref:M20/M25/M40 family metallo-hydrolase n=1 Tax=Flavobacterium sp. W22_SRS_FP1 TaxID=3240276 RepID=UPI003F9238D9
MKNILKVIIVFFSIIMSTSNYAQENNAIQNKYRDQLSKLIKNKKVKTAFEIIEHNDEQTIKDMIQLTEVLAPPFRESEKGLLFKKMIEEAGADKVWIDEEGNVLALRKGKTSEKLVGLDAHLDVVFPEGTNVKVTKVGDTLKAPGIGDDTRGLSMIISVLKALNQSKIETQNDILFVGSVGEEGLGDLRGMKYLFNKSNLKIDSWISIDGGDIGRINNAALGSKRYKVTFRGKGGHSWGSFGLANPNHALGKAIDYFSQEAAKYTSNGEKTSFNIGRIGGGTSINSIPFESWMEVDMRSVSSLRLEEIENIFKESITRAVKDYNASNIKDEVTLELDKIGERPSGELSKDLPLIQRAMAATLLFGEKPELTIGSTNASIPISKNIPAICIGRGGESGGAHSLHEWYLNKKGAEAIKLALLITLSEAELIN